MGVRQSWLQLDLCAQWLDRLNNKKMIETIAIIKGVAWSFKNRTILNWTFKKSGFWMVGVVRLYFFILSPPAKALSCDIIMHTVQFWGQGRSYLPIRECPAYDWKRGKGRRKYSVGCTYSIYVGYTFIS